MKHIYVFESGSFGEDIRGTALCEDGHVLGQHVSSSESWLQHDLGVTSKSRHDDYALHCPDGFTVEFVPKDARDSHVGLQAAITAHRELNKRLEAAP